MNDLDDSRIREFILEGFPNISDEQRDLFTIDLLMKDFYLIKSNSFDLTGVRIWPGSRLLARYLCYHALNSSSDTCISNHSSFSCLELGAGIGMAGIVASKLFDQVTISDGSLQAVEMIRKNVDCSYSTNIRYFMYKWGEPLDQSYNLVIASDIVYPDQSKEAFQALFSSIDSALSGGDVNCDIGASFVCSYIHRCENAANIFFQTSLAHDFECQVIEIPEFVYPVGYSDENAAILRFRKKTYTSSAKFLEDERIQRFLRPSVVSSSDEDDHGMMFSEFD